MANLSPDSSLRKHLTALLTAGEAHITFADAIKDFPVEHAGLRPAGLGNERSPHSAWELLEHLRLAQADILRFSQSSDYVELKFPDDYWPASPTPASPAEWETSVNATRADLEQFNELLNDEQRDLFEPFPWGHGQTLLREALLIADHNSYHLGQLMLIRRMVEPHHPARQ
jgi:hypothetical protein